MLSLQSQTVRGVLCTVFLVFGQMVSGQQDDLTGDFGKLSAKERAQIARDEEENAAKDLVFQGLMTEADALFRRQDFDGSLSKYMDARALRPYNVYPKVKIQDLQALIARREEERTRSAGQAEVRDSMDTDLVDRGRTEPSPAPIVLETPSAPPAPARVEPAQLQPSIPHHHHQAPKPPNVPGSRHVVPDLEPAPALAEGERVYKEGRSVVVETVVAEADHTVVYRKVSHPWGEQHYFREGLPISERSYKAALGR